VLPVEDRWLSVDDLMEYLGISRDTVYDWLVKKGLPGHKVGRLWKFKRAEIDAWVRAGSAAVGESPSSTTDEGKSQMTTVATSQQSARPIESQDTEAQSAAKKKAVSPQQKRGRK
jgi:excisionase family DNA binding protein